MWERFRKTSAKPASPAPDLILGLRALQGLFLVSFLFLGLEWLRGRQLPYEFLLYALLAELLIFTALWALFRLGRLKRQTMHRLALWTAAATSLPVSVYLTLVDAGGEIRFVLLLIWFLAYGRATGILLTVLYISGVGALLLLSGKFDFFAGNDPIRSLIRSSLLSLALLPILIYIRSRMLRRSMRPIRLTHTLLRLQKLINHDDQSAAGKRLLLPANARDLWAWTDRPDRSGLFVRQGPAPGYVPGILIRIDFSPLAAFAANDSPRQQAESISRRLLEWQEAINQRCRANGLWMNPGPNLEFWATLENVAGIEEALTALLQRYRQDRKSSLSRGMEYPAIRVTLHCGELWLLSTATEQIRAIAGGTERELDSQTASRTEDLSAGQSQSSNAPFNEAAGRSGEYFLLINCFESRRLTLPLIQSFSDSGLCLEALKKMAAVDAESDSGLTE
ncbi:MAG: hypothetical protein CMN76_09670 [Spirochaetaceae bacterium]|nr:hypothetical protein [Spirochaetaceae bacterium]|tara:strand:+ start:99133 stop:100482 length:1350 start_codon:yes stop_codon:yes gene_type:complete